MLKFKLIGLRNHLSVMAFYLSPSWYQPRPQGFNLKANEAGLVLLIEIIFLLLPCT